MNYTKRNFFVNSLKLFCAVLALFVILSCNRITQRVEQKVNEKIDKTIDENIGKIDSAVNQITLDSLKKSIDKLDSVTKKLDDKFNNK